MGIKLNYQDSNFDIQTEIVEKYLNGVSDKLKNNPSFGYLTIKASSASEAIPVSGLKIEVSSDNIIF